MSLIYDLIDIIKLYDINDIRYDIHFFLCIITRTDPQIILRFDPNNKLNDWWLFTKIKKGNFYQVDINSLLNYHLFKQYSKLFPELRPHFLNIKNSMHLAIPTEVNKYFRNMQLDEQIHRTYHTINGCKYYLFHQLYEAMFFSVVIANQLYEIDDNHYEYLKKNYLHESVGDIIIKIIDLMKNIINQLKNHIKYQPDSDFYVELSNKYSNIMKK